LQGKTESFKWNAHVTSVHCDTIGRHVPWLQNSFRSPFQINGMSVVGSVPRENTNYDNICCLQFEDRLP
jgi:hypothetical protein